MNGRRYVLDTNVVRRIDAGFGLRAAAGAVLLTTDRDFDHLDPSTGSTPTARRPRLEGAILQAVLARLRRRASHTRGAGGAPFRRR